MALARAIATLGGWTMASRLLGFCRDILFASIVEIGTVSDAFFVAFKFPNFFRRLFAEGAFTQAFVPVFTEARAQRSPEEVRALVDVASGTLAGVLAVVTGLAMLAASALGRAAAFGF